MKYTDLADILPEVEKTRGVKFYKGCIVDEINDILGDKIVDSYYTKNKSDEIVTVIEKNLFGEHIYQVIGYDREEDNIFGCGKSKSLDEIKDLLLKNPLLFL